MNKQSMLKFKLSNLIIFKSCNIYSNDVNESLDSLEKFIIILINFTMAAQ